MDGRIPDPAQERILRAGIHAPTGVMITGRAANRFRELERSLCAENMPTAHVPEVGSWIGSTEVEGDNQELMTEFGVPDG